MTNVEACVRLLKKCVRDYEASAHACDTPPLARFRAERAETAASLSALASALPGIMQDGGRLDWLEKCARDALHLDEGEYDSCTVVEAEHHSDVPEGEVWFTAVGAQMRAGSRGGSYRTGEATTIREAIDAARATQPEETSR